jgi:hypothetical protein
MCHRTLYTNFGHIFIAPQHVKVREGEDFPPGASRNNNFPPSPPGVAENPPPRTDLPICAPLALYIAASDSDSAPTSNSRDAFYGGETNKAMTTPFFPTRRKIPEKMNGETSRATTPFVMLICDRMRFCFTYYSPTAGQSDVE